MHFSRGLACHSPPSWISPEPLGTGAYSRDTSCKLNKKQLSALSNIFRGQAIYLALDLKWLPRYLFVICFTEDKLNNIRVETQTESPDRFDYFVASERERWMATAGTKQRQQVVRQGFLWCMAAIYLFAFTSLYVQIPGQCICKMMFFSHTSARRYLIMRYWQELW